MAGPTPSNLYSFSRVKTFVQCPARYRYRYVKRLSEAFRSIETFLGNAVHEVLEWMYKERSGADSPSLHSCHEAYDAQWNKSWDASVAIIRLSESTETYFELGRELLQRFHGETFERDQSETLGLEVRLSKRLSDNVVFTGVADRLGRTTNGRLFVVDYKTSKKMGDGSELSEGLQAPLYAAMALEKHPDAEAAAGYHYLRHGKTNWQSVNRERAAALVGRFLELADQARTATEFPPKTSVLCAWCGFNPVCPAADVPDALSGGARHAAEAENG